MKNIAVIDAENNANLNSLKICPVCREKLYSQTVKQFLPLLNILLLLGLTHSGRCACVVQGFSSVS